MMKINKSFFSFINDEIINVQSSPLLKIIEPCNGSDSTCKYIKFSEFKNNFYIRYVDKCFSALTFKQMCDGILMFDYENILYVLFVELKSKLSKYSMKTAKKQFFCSFQLTSA